MSKPPAKSTTARPRTRAYAAAKPPRRSKGRPKREEQKVGAETLVLQTCELLRTARPREITIAAVARHAGVNPALIRYYFGDRAGLMTAVARHLFDETAHIREPITTPESAERAVRRIVRSMIDLHRRYPAFRELFFEDIMNTPSKAARQLFTDSIKGEIARAESILTLLRGARPATDVDPKVESALLHVALIGMGELYVSAFRIIEIGAGSRLDRQQADKQFIDFVTNMILNGLRNA